MQLSISLGLFWLKCVFVRAPLYLNFKSMDNYFTPVKDMPSCHKNIKSTTQPREGDWICLNCNNLNFSFRKKCNRCKVQTRQQNESSTAYYLNYYSKSYLYTQTMPTQPCRNSSNAPTSANSQPTFQTPSHHKQKRSLENKENKENKTPEKHKKDLPSVSPLIKKYNARETTPLSECSSDQSVWGVVVRDFEEVLASSRRSDECIQWSQDRNQQAQREEQQLQRMINSIML